MAADNYERVYVIGDADDAGRRMVNAVLGDIPWARRVELSDGLDPRDLLQRDGKNALDELIKRADLNAALFAALVTANNLGEFRAKLLAMRKEMAHGT